MAAPMRKEYVGKIIRRQDQQGKQKGWRPQKIGACWGWKNKQEITNNSLISTSSELPPTGHLSSATSSLTIKVQKNAQEKKQESPKCKNRQRAKWRRCWLCCAQKTGKKVRCFQPFKILWIRKLWRCPPSWIVWTKQYSRGSSTHCRISHNYILQVEEVREKSQVPVPQEERENSKTGGGTHSS